MTLFVKPLLMTTLKCTFEQFNINKLQRLINKLNPESII